MELIFLAIIYLLFFVFGIVMGSFYNVVAYRIIKNDYRGILTDRSACPNCNTRLKPKDLVPLLSYIYLKGKCRYCGSKISFIYFSFELLTGISFVLTYIYFSEQLIICLIFVSILLTIFNLLYRKIKEK
jgi:prepilin signal peptidase PulO-like enzyme (type II secretory pathway)